MNSHATQNLHHDAEPTVSSGTGTVYLPMWLTGLLGLLVFWGCNYVDARGGNHSELVYEPYRSTNEVAGVLPQDETAQMIKAGFLVYRQLCAGCHQDSGMGTPGLYPPLVGSEWVLGNANRLIRIPITGLTGPIKVAGTDWNLTMPPVAIAGVVTDDQLAAVLTYIRNSWGNKAPTITPEHVIKVRADLKDRASQYTADELLKLPEAIP